MARWVASSAPPSVPARVARGLYFMTVISSRDNPTFKKLLSLHAARGIRLNRLFLAGGEKIIREIIREKPDRVAYWIRTPRLPEPPTALSADSIAFSGELFKELNVIGTTGPLLALRLPDLPVFSTESPWPPGCTIFIPFADPENVGAVIRSAVGLGASRVVLLQEAAFPFLPRAVRASAGAIMKIRIEAGPALEKLAGLTAGTPVYALDLQGQSLGKIKWPPVFGLLAGMEGPGLPRESAGRWTPVAIPLQGGLESLNAAAAVAIALWTWKSRAARDKSNPDI